MSSPERTAANSQPIGKAALIASVPRVAQRAANP